MRVTRKRAEKPGSVVQVTVTQGLPSELTYRTIRKCKDSQRRRRKKECDIPTIEDRRTCVRADKEREEGKERRGGLVGLSSSDM